MVHNVRTYTICVIVYNYIVEKTAMSSAETGMNYSCIIVKVLTNVYFIISVPATINPAAVSPFKW